MDYLTAAQSDDSGGDVLYYTATTADSLYTVDLSTGEPTLVGDMETNIYGLSYCDSVLYGATESVLYTIETSTGAVTRVHATNVLTSSSLPVRGLACVNNMLYVSMHDGRYRVSTNLVNKQLGTSVFQGRAGVSGGSGTRGLRGIAGHGDGMYASIRWSGDSDNTPSNSLYALTVTGGLTRVRVLYSGYTSSYLGVASDNDNTLYILRSQNGAVLYSITDLGGDYDLLRVGTGSLPANGNNRRLAYARIVALDAPTNMTTSVLGTSVTLNWDAVTNATGYKVQWRTSNGTFGDAFEQTVTTNSATVSGLATNTTFYFQVIATRSGAEDSDPSDEQTVQIAAPLSPPVTVTGLRLSVLGNSITADWDSASNADSYNVQWRTSGGTFGITNQIITTSRTATIEDLAENTPFQVRVIATRSGALDGTPSSVVSATTEEIITSPSQVGGVDAYPMGDSTGASVYVEWDDVAEADEYKVQWGTNRGTVDSTNQVSVSTNNAIISSSIANNTTYYIRVIATRNGADDGRGSAEVSVRTTLPSGLTISAYTESNNRATMRWSDSQSYNIAASGDEGWFIRCAAADDEFDLVQRLSANEDLRSISTSAIGFQPGGAMKCQVQVRDTDGDPVSLWSASATRTFPHATIITTAIYSDGSRTVELEWTGEDRANWHYAVSFDSTPRYTRTLTDTDAARSETLSNVYVPPGQTMYVWVYGSTSATPSLTNSSYLAWSGAHAIGGNDVGECDAAHVQDVGELTGTERSESGRWDSGACLIDDFDYSDDEYHDDFEDYSLATVRLYSLSVRSSRAMTVTLNYVTEHTTAMAIASTSNDERHAWGGYVLRIRQASFDGTIVETKDDTYKQGTQRLRQDPSIELNAAGGQVYVVEVMQYGIGGGRDFSMDVMFSFIPEATPTPFPTQTPVPRINVDFRLHPNPGFINYEAGQVYGFTMEGDSGKLPAVVRAGNSPVLAVGKVDTIVCDIDSPAADDSALFNSIDEKVYVRICMDNNNSSLEIISEADGQFLASYTLYVAGDILATPGPVEPSIGVGEDASGQDHVGITIFVGAICEAAGMRCDSGLIKTGFTIILALAGAVMPIIYTRGRASTGSVGLSVVFFLFGLILGALLVGFALWIVGVVLFAVVLLAGLAIYGRMSALRT